MIDKIVLLIIQDLGPTGLLVVGLYFVIGQHLKKMGQHLEVINKEVGEIRDIIKWQK